MKTIIALLLSAFTVSASTNIVDIYSSKTLGTIFDQTYFSTSSIPTLNGSNGYFTNLYVTLKADALSGATNSGNAIIAPAMMDRVYKVPPMSWMSWGLYSNFDVSETNVLTWARVMTNVAFRDWDLVEINDQWTMLRNPVNNHLIPEPTRFPNGIDGLANTIHSMGLKLGLFYSMGPYSEGGGVGHLCPGSQDYWELDAQDACNWNIDMLFLVNDSYPLDAAKIENGFRRFASTVYSNNHPMFLQGTYHGNLPATWMSHGLNGYYNVGKYPDGVTDTRDMMIYDNTAAGWSNMHAIIDCVLTNSYLIRPGHYFNAYLAGGAEPYGYQSQMGIAALFSMKVGALSFLQDTSNQAQCQTNKTLISILKDPLVIPAKRIVRSTSEIFVKPLWTGSKAVGAWSRPLIATNVNILASDLGWSSNAVISFADVFDNNSTTIWSNSVNITINAKQLRLFIASSTNTLGNSTITTVSTAGFATAKDPVLTDTGNNDRIIYTNGAAILGDGYTDRSVLWMKQENDSSFQYFHMGSYRLSVNAFQILWYPAFNALDPNFGGAAWISAPKMIFDLGVNGATYNGYRRNREFQIGNTRYSRSWVSIYADSPGDSINDPLGNSLPFQFYTPYFNGSYKVAKNPTFRSEAVNTNGDWRLTLWRDFDTAVLNPSTNFTTFPTNRASDYNFGRTNEFRFYYPVVAQSISTLNQQFGTPNQTSLVTYLMLTNSGTVYYIPCYTNTP